MAEDQKQQLQRPQDFFPKEEEEEGECGCKTNPNTALFDVLALCPPCLYIPVHIN